MFRRAPAGIITGPLTEPSCVRLPAGNRNARFCRLATVRDLVGSRLWVPMRSRWMIRELMTSANCLSAT